MQEKWLGRRTGGSGRRGGGRRGQGVAAPALPQVPPRAAVAVVAMRPPLPRTASAAPATVAAAVTRLAALLTRPGADWCR